MQKQLKSRKMKQLKSKADPHKFSTMSSVIDFCSLPSFLLHSHTSHQLSFSLSFEHKFTSLIECRT